MQLYFINHKAERLFADHEKIRKSFKKGTAVKIIMAIDHLAMAKDMSVLYGNRTFRLHELHGRDSGRFSLDVSANERLIVSPFGKYGLKKDGGIDLQTVICVMIEEVKDTHEGKVRRH